MTAAEWTVIAGRIHTMYSRELRREWAEGWYPIVATYDREVIEEAFRRYLHTEQVRYMPTGGDLARMAEDIIRPGVSFDQAWTELTDAQKRIGSWGSPELSREAADIVRFLGGWKTVCEIPNDRMETARAQARMAYADMSRRRESEASRLRLAEGRPQLAEPWGGSAHG